MRDEYLRKASVAHDIKNLITRACLAVEALEQTDEEKVHRQTRRLSRVLEQVATVCTREFEAPVPAKAIQSLTSADIKQLLREAVLISRKGRAQSYSRISCKVAVEPNVDLTIDRVLLFRVLFNLASNALNAMAKSGGASLSLKVHRDADRVVFDVIDDGPGLPDRILAFLYPRADEQPLQRGRLGTGLMSAVSLASELGGQLTLLRSSTAGSAFRLTVPTGTNTCQTPETQIYAQQPVAHRPQTLLASRS